MATYGWLIKAITRWQDVAIESRWSAVAWSRGRLGDTTVMLAEVFAARQSILALWELLVHGHLHWHNARVVPTAMS